MWQTYRVALNADGGWHRIDGERRTLATDEDIKRALASVQHILIPGEFLGGVEVVDLDNVAFIGQGGSER